jgi:DHA1 family inner membrane transport protein
LSETVPVAPTAQTPTADGIAAGSDLRILLLGCLLYVAGSAIFYVMPAYLTFVGNRLSLNAEQIGSLASVESLAIGITSLSSPLWIARLDRRFCILAGILVCALGNLATAYSSSFNAVLASRFLLGLLGEGVILTMSFPVLASVRNVDRGFAIALTAVTAAGSAITAIASSLNRLLPVLGLLAPLILIAVAILPFMDRSRPRPRPRPQVVGVAAKPSIPAERRSIDWLAMLALVAQMIWFAAPGAFWTFAEQVAIDKGASTGTAELALSLSQLVGLLGSVVAAMVGDRWGRLRPIIVGTIGMAVSAVVYQFCDGEVGLVLFLSTFYFFWNYAVVYQMSFIAYFDHAGRYTIMMPAAQVFGLSIGPLCAGRLILSNGDSAVTLSTLVFAAAGLGLYLICFSYLRRSRGSAAVA